MEEIAMKAQHPLRVLSAGSVAGTEVRNPEGERLGIIIDLMIDCEIGQVAYAVLSVGKFPGHGEKLFALPWIAMTVEHASDAQRRHFVLDIDKAWLNTLPGFNKEYLPEYADLRFTHTLYRHNGYRPYDEHLHDELDSIYNLENK